MLTLRRFKATLLTALAVLLICAVVAYAHDYSQKGNYTKNVYWNIGVGHLGYDGEVTNSEHNYAVENNSNKDVSVDWEFTHRVMGLPPGLNPTVLKEIKRTGFLTVKKNKASYWRDTLGTGSFGRGDFRIDAYTSVEIKRLNAPDKDVVDTNVSMTSDMFTK